MRQANPMFAKLCCKYLGAYPYFRSLLKILCPTEAFLLPKKISEFVCLALLRYLKYLEHISEMIILQAALCTCHSSCVTEDTSILLLYPSRSCWFGDIHYSVLPLPFQSVVAVAFLEMSVPHTINGHRWLTSLISVLWLL